jgi:hypothetical protein
MRRKLRRREASTSQPPSLPKQQQEETRDVHLRTGQQKANLKNKNKNKQLDNKAVKFVLTVQLFPCRVPPSNVA